MAADSKASDGSRGPLCEGGPRVGKEGGEGGAAIDEF